MGVTPMGLQNRPSIEECNKYWLDVFDTLSAGRGAGMSGPAPISLVNIAAYCSLFEIRDIEERAQLIRYVQYLDGVFFEVQSERAATNGNSEVATSAS